MSLFVQNPVDLSIDNGSLLFRPVYDTGGGAFRLHDDAYVWTAATIRSLGADDRLVIHGAGLVKSTDDVGFTTYNDRDISISYNDGSNVADIVLEGAMHNPGFVYDYATAVAAVGFDFMVIA